MPIDTQTVPEFVGERLDNVIPLKISRIDIDIALIDHAVSVLILSPAQGVPSCRETLKGNPVSRSITEGNPGVGPHASCLDGP